MTEKSKWMSFSGKRRQISRENQSQQAKKKSKEKASGQVGHKNFAYKIVIHSGIAGILCTTNPASGAEMLNATGIRIISSLPKISKRSGVLLSPEKPLARGVSEPEDYNE